MILPIVAYGDPALRKKGEDISHDHPGLKELIQNMFETMYNAPGVGLAAPQVGLSIRLFVVDSKQLFEDEEKPQEEGVKQAFVNPQMIEEMDDEWPYEEGCLSIPGVREDVSRQSRIRMRYMDEDFNEYEKEFTGITARIIQHEYDHIEGILFTDRLKPLKRRLLKKKLNNISKGQVEVSYKMLFPMTKKGR